MKGILGLMMRDWMDEYDVMLLQEPGVSAMWCRLSVCVTLVQWRLRDGDAFINDDGQQPDSRCRPVDRGRGLPTHFLDKRCAWNIADLLPSYECHRLR